MLKTCRPFTKRSRIVVFLLSTLALLLFGAQPLCARDESSQKVQPDKLFSSDDTLRVTLTGPWHEIQQEKDVQKPYPGKLEFSTGQGERVSLDVTVERRGITRQRVCGFPPIRLRFDKEEVKGTIFRGQDSLKMVTHCENAKKFEQYYILEMLAYRMYNLITDFSFRVRSLDVTYIDSDNGEKYEDRFGFLIEDDSDVAKRHDLKKINTAKVHLSLLEPRVTSEMSLFQYMISNVDWSALKGPDGSCCHNTKLIGPEPLHQGDKVYPIPYDFDASGLVDAHYAAPAAGLPVDTVTKRLYRGYCVFNDELEATREVYLAQENAILALIENEDRLYAKTKARSTKYLGNFFKTIKNPRYFEKYIMKKCRK